METTILIQLIKKSITSQVKEISMVKKKKKKNTVNVILYLHLKIATESNTRVKFSTKT